jgi:MoxR-like ATPase
MSAIESREMSGSQFYNDAMLQLDGYMLGSEQQKKAAVLGLLVGLPAMYYGYPGQGKTQLAEGVPRLIDGVADKTLWVPANSDLAPSSLAGAQVMTEKSKNGEEPYKETTIIPGLINPETRAMVLDEITRLSPFALNALLRVIEGGKVIGNGVNEDVDLIMQVSTSNPSEQGQSTFKISDAALSRHAIGIPFFPAGGHRVTANLARGQFGFLPRPVEPIISEKDFRSMQSSVEQYELTQQQAEMVSTYSHAVRELVAENYGQNDGENRAAIQLGRIVRARMALEGLPFESNKRDNDQTLDIIKKSSLLLANARMSTKIGTSSGQYRKQGNNVMTANDEHRMVYAELEERARNYDGDKEDILEFM